MRILTVIKKIIKAIIPPLFFLSLTGYFIWNTFNGDHGLESYYKQQKSLVEAQQAQQDALSEQNAWNKRVNGLKENALDADLLDERTRIMLSYAKNDEIVIPYKNNEHLY